MARIRILTAGESHGPKLAAIVEGLPAGLRLDVDAMDRDLARRQAGYGRGYRSRGIERDVVALMGGVRFGETIGAPVLLEVANLDHPSWAGVMDALPVEDRSLADARSVRRPRPGHADLSGALKYGRSDMRDVLERASARNTCVRVAAGGLAKALLRELGVEVFAFVTKIGGVEWPLPDTRDAAALGALRVKAEASDVSCPDEEISKAMRARIDEAKHAKDTVGGAFAVFAVGLCAGLGSYVEPDRKLDARLAGALMSIQAVKAVEIGIGSRAGDVFGSEAHDEITFDAQRRGDGTGGFGRRTNRAGGLEGGMTNGAPVVVRGTMKPIATLAKPLESVDFVTKEPVKAAYERSDTCAVPACAVIAEAEVALCLADAALEALGGDTMAELKAAHAARKARYAET